MSNDECPGRSARWGFPWSEWLVIIGIIVILASLGVSDIGAGPGAKPSESRLNSA
jgi:hypothetical protein